MRAGTTTSFSNMTPLSTRLSSMAPPGIFSTLAYFLQAGRQAVRATVKAAVQTGTV
jgi:hypothetical protein